MAKFTVVKQTVFIVEADNDAEANNIVSHDITPGLRPESEGAFFVAEYTNVYSYGVEGVITSLTMEYEPERDECRRASGYVDTQDDRVSL